MAVSLTYSDIRQIAINFDQTHGSSLPSERDYQVINYIHKNRQIAGDVNNYIVTHYLPTNPSVTAVLDLYKGTPATNGKPMLRDLDSASRVILEKLGEKLPMRLPDLFRLKQLLSFVFVDYFKNLPAAEKLEMLKNWEECPDLVIGLETIAQIQDVREKMKRLNAVRRHWLPPDFEQAETKQQLSQLLQDMDWLSWFGCADKLSLDPLWVIGAGVLTTPFLIALPWAAQNFKLGIAALTSVTLFAGLVFYELVITNLLGLSTHLYRSYCGLNSRDEPQIHLRLNAIISTYKYRIINQDPPAAFVEKWQNRAIEIIV